jgi:hypothetical protein
LRPFYFLKLVGKMEPNQRFTKSPGAILPQGCASQILVSTPLIKQYN